MSEHTFVLNGERVTVEVADDERLLWVLRDVLGVRGPKYGCGINVCKACTSHINGRVFNPCAVPVGALAEDDQVTTIEGLAASVGRELHPMQEAWLEQDVAQCGYCQPGQVMRPWPRSTRPTARDARSPTATWTRSATSVGAAPTPGSAQRSSGRAEHVRSPLVSFATSLAALISVPRC